MTCDSDYNCSITWNTNSLTEGTYTLFINTTGTMDYLVSSSITVTVDNTPPTLDILQPLETQVSGMIYPKVLVTDYYSVNPSEIKFEINGETYSMNCLQQTQNKQYRCTGNFNTTSLSDGTYTLKFIAKDQAGNENSTSKEIIINNLSPGETTTYNNNQTVTIYAKASDILGNTGYSWINTTVDNEIPSLIIAYPDVNQTLSGIVNLQINVTDLYSGIDTSNIKYEIQSTQRSMDCTGSQCDEYLDTTKFSDGSYTITFYAYDNAGNLNQSSISIYIDNTRSSISFTNIADNDYIRDIITIYAKISNPTEELGDVNFKWTTTSSSSDWQKMTCDSDYNCSITWNTNSLTEGTYTLFINTTGTMDYLVSSSITVTVDNTPPTLDILQPLETQVSGMIYPKVLVTDYYSVNPSEIKFEINGETYSMNCLQQTQNKQYRCTGNFNTTSLSDGTYTLKFIAKDQAGNENSTSKEIIINNLSPGETTTTQEGEVTTTTISSGEESGVGKTIRNTTNKINNYFSKIIYNKSALIAILVLISIVFISYFLLRNIGKQKIEIEENEI